LIDFRTSLAVFMITPYVWLVIVMLQPEAAAGWTGIA
jgi:hypothetical protein